MLLLASYRGFNPPFLLSYFVQINIYKAHKEKKAKHLFRIHLIYLHKFFIRDMIHFKTHYDCFRRSDSSLYVKVTQIFFRWGLILSMKKYLFNELTRKMKFLAPAHISGKHQFYLTVCHSAFCCT